MHQYGHDDDCDDAHDPNAHTTFLRMVMRQVRSVARLGPMGIRLN